MTSVYTANKRFEITLKVLVLSIRGEMSNRTTLPQQERVHVVIPPETYELLDIYRLVGEPKWALLDRVLRLGVEVLEKNHRVEKKWPPIDGSSHL